LKDVVFAVERQYAAAGVQPTLFSPASNETVAASGAVASRYLAVGTPHSFGIVGDGVLSLEAHRTWFDPRDIRCTDALVPGGRLVSVDEALAADIVCIHRPLSIAASQLRRGTHVNALAPVQLDPELRAWVVGDQELASIVAGLVDGRQLDEITIFAAAGL
jgi:ornithine cyclodeaminase/alanine dehydrogenase-like protein (mu-crystallin family)